MCLITPNKRGKTLKEDLIVYKEMYHNDGVFTSKHKRFVYTVDTLHKTKVSRIDVQFVRSLFGIVLRNCVCCDHIADQHIDDLAVSNENLVLYAFQEGFHFFTSSDRATWYCLSTVIIKCIVPAGSKVYFDGSGLGIANQIIITNEFQNLYPHVLNHSI